MAASPGFTIYTDIGSLETLHTYTNISKRQIRWMKTFQSYVFDFHHIPREQNHAADALLERSPVEPSHPDASVEIHAVSLRITRKSMVPDVIPRYRHDTFCGDLVKHVRTTEDPTFSLGEEQLLIRTSANGVKQVCVPPITTLLNHILYDSERYDGPYPILERMGNRITSPMVPSSER